MKFIQLTSPTDGTDVFIQPIDVKGVSATKDGTSTDILLYGSNFISVRETPAEVVRIVEDAIYPPLLDPSPHFLGRN